MTIDSSQELISIVVPAFNEAQSLERFHAELSQVLDEHSIEAEIIFINDGSTDETLEILRSIAVQDARVISISLSRNYGKEIALTAGIDHATGSAVIPMDADLQHPPALIPEFIRKWHEGYDVVYAVRKNRNEEAFIKKVSADIFYRLMSKLSGRIQMQPHAGDYRLISRNAADALKTMREQHRFMKGLYSAVGFRQTSIPFEPNRRYAGKTKWSLVNLISLSIEGITSFSTAPLRIATIFGLLCALVSFVYALWITLRTLIYGEPVTGFPTLIVAILFLGGIQLISLGIIGEYLGRIFDESKNRPLYFVAEIFQNSNEVKRDEHVDVVKPISRI